MKEQLVRQYNEEKQMMKREIYVEVEELLKINEETVRRVKGQEGVIRELNKEVD
jgi:hypothetical protein